MIYIIPTGRYREVYLGVLVCALDSTLYVASIGADWIRPIYIQSSKMHNHFSILALSEDDNPICCKMVSLVKYKFFPQEI